MSNSINNFYIDTNNKKNEKIVIGNIEIGNIKKIKPRLPEQKQIEEIIKNKPSNKIIRTFFKEHIEVITEEDNNELNFMTSFK